jgi:hypothetical protein
VKSCVICIVKTSVCCCLLVVFLALSSPEFTTKIFLVTCAIVTLINEWDVQGTMMSEGVHSLGWVGPVEN